MNKPLLYLPLVVILLLGSVFLYVLRADLNIEELRSPLLGKSLPSASLSSIEFEGRLDPSDLHQQGPFLLNVWATWCPACYDEHPVLNRLAQQGVRIIGLNYQDDAEAAERWLIELHNPYALNLQDADGRYGFDLGVYGAPETYFVDGEGLLRHRQIGEFTMEMWDNNLQSIWESMQ